jgi:hypothetical protein
MSIPMSMRSALIRRGFAVLAASGAVVIASCGTSSDYGVGQRYPVSGTVTYNGQPLEKGMISFVPDTPKSAGATGAIEKGAYALSTVGDRDGARPGKYKVTITSKEDSYSKAQADFQKLSGREPGVFVPRHLAAQAAAEAKDNIPAGYGNTSTTTLTAEVKEQSNTINFELSDASAPPEPANARASTKSRGRRK